MKKPKDQKKLDKRAKTLNNMNKMKEFSNKLKKKVYNKEDINKEKEVKKDEIESLSEGELNDITNGFLSDLYKEKEDEQPKTRAEKREIDKEKEEKIKNVAKTINSLNNDDKTVVLEKLKNYADDEKKKEQYNKLNNLINNTNNLKSYIKKLVNEKLNEDKNKIENKNGELNNNELNDLNNGFNEDLFPYEKDIHYETKISDKHLNKVNKQKIDKAVDIIKDLNPSQQKQILENIKSKAAEEKDLEKFKIIFKKLKDVKKMKNLINK